jgi:endonuclease YncB( thermonuclease family)
MFYSNLIDWDQVTYETAEKFVPPISYGKVVKVYDGDTITVATPLDYTRAPIYHFSVRLRGIDSPEIRGKTEEEKQAALVARNALSAKVLNQMVFLQNIDTEKYGRLLADVFLEGEPKQSISEWMLEHQYAIKYTGGTKAPFHSSLSQETGEIEEDAYYKITTW